MLLNSLMETNNLEQAIAYNPLIVTPDTLVTDAISLMSNARASCTLKNISSDTNYLLADARASCVLVMEDKQLVGIFTMVSIACLISLTSSVPLGLGY
jgi:CBS domain-containing protein